MLNQDCAIHAACSTLLILISCQESRNSLIRSVQPCSSLFCRCGEMDCICMKDLSSKSSASCNSLIKSNASSKSCCNSLINLGEWFFQVSSEKYKRYSAWCSIASPQSQLRYCRISSISF